MADEDHVEIMLVKKDIGEIKCDIKGIKETFDKILYPLSDWKIETDTKLKIGGWAIGIISGTVLFQIVVMFWNNLIK